jgi:hypothetical protein
MCYVHINADSKLVANEFLTLKEVSIKLQNLKGSDVGV